MPKCHNCEAYYDRSFRHCPVCNAPEPVHKRTAITEVITIPTIGDRYDGQTIIAVHLTGRAGLELTLAGGLVVDFDSWRDLHPVSSTPVVAPIA